MGDQLGAIFVPHRTVATTATLQSTERPIASEKSQPLFLTLTYVGRAFDVGNGMIQIVVGKQHLAKLGPLYILYVAVTLIHADASHCFPKTVARVGKNRLTMLIHAILAKRVSVIASHGVSFRDWLVAAQAHSLRRGIFRCSAHNLFGSLQLFFQHERVAMQSGNRVVALLNVQFQEGLLHRHVSNNRECFLVQSILAEELKVQEP
jgi:hypothetical protein